MSLCHSVSVYIIVCRYMYLYIIRWHYMSPSAATWRQLSPAETIWRHMPLSDLIWRYLTLSDAFLPICRYLTTSVPNCPHRSPFDHVGRHLTTSVAIWRYMSLYDVIHTHPPHTSYEPSILTGNTLYMLCTHPIHTHVIYTQKMNELVDLLNHGIMVCSSESAQRWSFSVVCVRVMLPLTLLCLFTCMFVYVLLISASLFCWLLAFSWSTALTNRSKLSYNSDIYSFFGWNDRYHHTAFPHAYITGISKTRKRDY